jgi:hypothetical protein
MSTSNCLNEEFRRPLLVRPSLQVSPYPCSDPASRFGIALSFGTPWTQSTSAPIDQALLLSIKCTLGDSAVRGCSEFLSHPRTFRLGRHLGPWSVVDHRAPDRRSGVTGHTCRWLVHHQSGPRPLSPTQNWASPKARPYGSPSDGDRSGCLPGLTICSFLRP